MSTKILKPTMLALAGAVALAAAGSASADLACIFKGQTSLTVGTTTTECWLNTVVKVDCDGNVVLVRAAGANAGQATCPGLFLGNFPWQSDLTSIVAGNGTIDTTAGSGGVIPFAVQDPSGNPLAGGNVYNVDGSTTSNYICDGNTIAVPDFVAVTGMNNFGPGPDGDPNNATFNTIGPDHLQNLGCN